MRTDIPDEAYNPPEPEPAVVPAAGIYRRGSDDDYTACEEICEKIMASGTDITTEEPVWHQLGCAIYNCQGEDGRELFHAISRFYPSYKHSETDKKYNQISRRSYNYGIGTLIYHAKRNGII